MPIHMAGVLHFICGMPVAKWLTGSATYVGVGMHTDEATLIISIEKRHSILTLPET